MLYLVPRHELSIANANGFGVDHRYAQMRFQFFGADDIRINLPAQRNDRLGTLLDQFFSDCNSTLDDDVVVAGKIAGIVETNGANAAHERCHAVSLHDSHGVRHVGFERHDDAESIADSRGEVERRASEADHWNAHRQPARFDPRIESVALDHAVETPALRFDGFFDQCRSFEDVMQP